MTLTSGAQELELLPGGGPKANELQDSCKTQADIFTTVLVFST